MAYIITDFKKWKPLFEQEEDFVSPGRTKQTAGLGQRVVAIPIKRNVFKIKIIRDLDIIGKDGKLKTPGMNSVVKWLRDQIRWPNAYPALMDLKTNFILYTVNKDNKRSQVITCTLLPRKDQDYKGIPEDQNYVEGHELSTLTDNNLADHTTILNDHNDTANGKEADDDIDDLIANYLDTPIPLVQINRIKSTSKLFDLIDKVYIKFLHEPKISNLDFMAGAKTELKNNKLESNIKKMLEGIIAGFDIKDKYDDLETNITEKVVRRLIQIVGVKSLNEETTNSGTTVDKSFKDFDFSKFTSVVQPNGTAKVEKPEEKTEDLKSEPTNTGVEKNTLAPVNKEDDGVIRIPKGGLKITNSAPGDINLKKIQNLIISKFNTKLAKSGLFAKFKKYGADGKYGPTTENMIAALKAGYGMSDVDGKIITKPFLDNVVKVNINENVLTLDYMILEKFDMAAYSKIAKESSAEVVQSTKKVPAKVAQPIKKPSPTPFAKAKAKVKDEEIPGKSTSGSKI